MEGYKNPSQLFLVDGLETGGISFQIVVALPHPPNAEGPLRCYVRDGIFAQNVSLTSVLRVLMLRFILEIYGKSLSGGTMQGYEKTFGALLPDGLNMPLYFK
ncbi:hypothetical protein CEXT_553861 [Caerostris extrusa]|uniref:Uncharacterized protein n=1 Tax=Caerostris extrusa TaxID=172846 RepID=A0AAV4S8R5_CAEEX|nr:hypothetical protein CEXT_553861 [Caerostris extrusa]